MKTNYWVFDILPSGNYLSSFNTIKNYNYSVGEDSDAMPLNFILSSKHFENKENPNDVYQIGMFIVQLFNGFNNIIYKDGNETYKVRLGRLYKNGDENREKINTPNINYLEIDELLNFPDNNESYFEGFLNQAFRPGLIKNILLHCKDSWNLTSMYKLSDEISSFLKEQDDNIMNYVNKNQFKLFGLTANNFSVSGLEARHGKSVNKEPKKSMTLDESSEFIRELINKILEKYFGIKLNYIGKTESDFSDLFTEEF
ncbi:hypothetical protein [Tenacibaculum aquimarinum]|uniref:hypothetical protein n=1 Tax=Tenacibaculum aquimarinum TaxID=2910675 RepID=UPI001F0B62F1|nr:hypothetical protein [Tenacibaculum aquimarinum]MCH3883410.1 hypothetical protein [Tenacibaculum aquimarinum]